MKMLLCDVYKSSKKDMLYLYVDRGEGLERVPDALMAEFGEPTLALSLKLTPERKLAKEDAALVLAAIEKDGFFLQMPPQSKERYYKPAND